MEDYWETLNARVKSAEAFILGQDLKNLVSSNTRLKEDLSSLQEMQNQERGVSREWPVNHSIHSPVYTTFEQLNNTIEDGRSAFNNLILMTVIASLTGLVFLFLAVITGVFLQNDVITLIFGVIGISVLLAMFAMNPKEKIQVALVNMIQAQAIYLDYYNQMQIWMQSWRRATTQEERREASEALHSATSFTLKALQEYIGPSARN